MSGKDLWSRRKAAVASEAAAEEARAESATAEIEEATFAEREDAEILAELGVPDPDNMTSPAEIMSFIREKIPQRLKVRAYRRLWRLNPALANLDGLLEYGEDYTDKATVVENLATVYEVGKGMLGRFEELVADNDEEPDSEVEVVEDTPDAIEDELTTEVTEAPPEGSQSETAEAPIEADQHTEDTAHLSIHASSRRMQFQFEDNLC